MLHPTVNAEVERHWQTAQRARPLFNGRVFCADHVTPELIEGHWTEYRRVVAQMLDPLLFDELHVRNLAVCGALCCADGVLVGRRQPDALYQAGLWQLPPAGSVDAGAAREDEADLYDALLSELVEELGLGEPDVSILRPLCLVHHPGGVLDLGFQVSTTLTAHEVRAAQRDRGNPEYDRLLFAPAAAIEAAVQAEGGTLVPASREFLRRLA